MGSTVFAGIVHTSELVKMHKNDNLRVENNREEKEGGEEFTSDLCKLGIKIKWKVW